MIDRDEIRKEQERALDKIADAYVEVHAHLVWQGQTDIFDELTKITLACQRIADLERKLLGEEDERVA